MSGTITVVKTDDWLTPFEVHIDPRPGEGQPTVSRFSAAANAQENALGHADRLGYRLVYTVDQEPEQHLDPFDLMDDPMNMGHPKTSKRREISQREFQERYTRICSKCKQAKPLSQFGEKYHRNRTTRREVFHGWTNKCLACGGTD